MIGVSSGKQVGQLHGSGDDRGHVIVTVFGEPTAEDDVGLAVGHPAVALIQGLVSGVVDRIKGLHAFRPLGRILSRDDGRGISVDVVAEELEMLVLDHAGIRDIGRGEVDHGVALIVRPVEDLGLKPQAAVVKASETAVKKSVNPAREHDAPGQRAPVVTIVEEINTCDNFDAVKQSGDEAVVSADGDALPEVIEIIVVKSEAQGQSPDYKGRQIGASPAPLLLGVSFDEQFVDVTAYERQGLLLKVLRS